MSFGLEVYDEKGNVTFTTDDELLIIIGRVFVGRGAPQKTISVSLPDGKPACFAVESIADNVVAPIAEHRIDSMGNLTYKGRDRDTYIYYGVTL